MGLVGPWGQALVAAVVSFEVFKRSPQPLKTGIVATAVIKRSWSSLCTLRGA